MTAKENHANSRHEWNHLYFPFFETFRTFGFWDSCDWSKLEPFCQSCNLLGSYIADGWWNQVAKARSLHYRCCQIHSFTICHPLVKTFRINKYRRIYMYMCVYIYILYIYIYKTRLVLLTYPNQSITRSWIHFPIVSPAKWQSLLLHCVPAQNLSGNIQTTHYREINHDILVGSWKVLNINSWRIKLNPQSLILSPLHLEQPTCVFFLLLSFTDSSLASSNFYHLSFTSVACNVHISHAKWVSNCKWHTVDRRL